jgi:hypothetical protein
MLALISIPEEPSVAYSGRGLAEWFIILISISDILTKIVIS